MRWVLRLIIALISILYCVVGGVLLFLGSVYGAAKFGGYRNSSLDVIAVSFIVIGGVLCLVGMFGLITSCSKSFALAYLFSFILLFSIIIQSLAVILFVVFRADVESVLSRAALETIGVYPQNNSFYSKSVKYSWDSVQTGLRCCGISSYKDWTISLAGVPDSCCTSVQAGCGNITSVTSFAVPTNIAIPSNIHPEGCFEKFFKTAANRYEIVLPILIGLLVIQVSGVCFSCCLARSVQVEDCQMY